MTFTLLIAVGILALFLAVLVLSCRSMFARITASVFTFGFAAFCAFGFLASFEPSDSPNWPWQLAYGILGMGSLLAALMLLKGGWHRRRPSGSAN
jgi:uncharacterized membrane protein HdeD (DUF308 family)